MPTNAAITKRYRLDQLFPGEQLRLCGSGIEIVATLVDVNECEAKVTASSE